MPFDGCERDWEPLPERRLLYTVMPLGQKAKHRKWQLDILTHDGWLPVMSFYADTKREAYCLASWGIHTAEVCK